MCSTITTQSVLLFMGISQRGALTPLALLLPLEPAGRKKTGNHSHCIEVQKTNGQIEDNRLD